jgi:hypothetical protein
MAGTRLLFPGRTRRVVAGYWPFGRLRGVSSGATHAGAGPRHGTFPSDGPANHPEHAEPTVPVMPTRKHSGHFRGLWHDDATCFGATEASSQS